MGEWREMILGDLLTLQRGFDLPEAGRRIGRYPVIASTGRVGTHDEPIVHGPGVVIGRSGSLGGGQFIEGDFWPLNTTLWVKDFKGNDERFCYYLLKSLDLGRFNAGSGVPTLNRNHIHPLPILVPSDPREQKSIAHILGTLDNKIEVNRRLSETLEIMARTIFRSWFVDLDFPLLDRDNRRDNRVVARSSLPTQAGTPGTPLHWTMTSIWDLAEFANGATYSAFQPSSDRHGLPIVKIAELKAGITAQTKYSTVDMPGKHLIDTGDILFAWSGNPDTSIGTFLWTRGPAWLNQHIFKVTPHREIDKPFVLECLRFLKPEFAERARNKQTTGLGHVTVQDLKEMKVSKPNEELLRVWYEVGGLLHARELQTALESQTLEGLRDLLLPKLISGEIRIKDADRFLERAGV